MKSVNKTEKELTEELKALQERVSELEGLVGNSLQAPGTFGKRTDRSYPADGTQA